MYRVWPYDVVDEWVWLYRLGRKALPALHRFDAIFHVFWWAKETAMVVYRYDYIFVLLERARNECHYSTINHSQLLEELLPYRLIFHHAERHDCAETCHLLVVMFHWVVTTSCLGVLQARRVTLPENVASTCM